MSTQDSSRYTVISGDADAGADIYDYKPYLASQWYDEFEEWVKQSQDRWAATNVGRDVEQSWNSPRRLVEMDAEGISAEVVFPNTLPPFYPNHALTSTVPDTQEEYQRQYAGVQAHNRWLVDFVAEAPDRRRGVVQIMINDVERHAVAEIRWGKEHGLAAVLFPAPYPGHPVEQLWHPRYDPIWALAQELDMPINQHGGSGHYEVGDDPHELAIWQFDMGYFSHRTLWNLIYGGAFERFPELPLRDDRTRLEVGRRDHGTDGQPFQENFQPSYPVPDGVRAVHQRVVAASERVRRAQLLPDRVRLGAT